MLLQARLASTAVRSADYNTETSELTVAFHNGRTYTYANVPQHVFDELSQAASAGAYFNSQIKDQYGAL